MKFRKKKVSESVLKLRRSLIRNTEADKEEWAELVKKRIPLNLRKEWGVWIKKNIEELLEKGFEKQSEILIILFLSQINRNNNNSKPDDNNDEESRSYGHVEIRYGQSAFASRVRDNCNNKCVITGCSVTSRLQAAHISPHKNNIDYSVSNGLLLRADIHLMLDNGDCAINPVKKKIYFKQSVMDVDSDLVALDGKAVEGFKIDINWDEFEEGWIKTFGYKPEYSE